MSEVHTIIGCVLLVSAIVFGTQDKGPGWMKFVGGISIYLFVRWVENWK